MEKPIQIPNNSSLKFPNDANKIHIMSNFSKPVNQKVSFNDLPNEVIIKHMMFYLDIYSLPRFSRCNRKTSECVKTHIFIRIHFLGKEKKHIELENESIIADIEEKRRVFFNDYEIDPPSKDRAISLMQSISNNVSVKQVYFIL